MKVKEVVAHLGEGVADNYENHRKSGVAHKEAWAKAVGGLQMALNDMDMLCQMEATRILGEKYDLRTGELKEN